ncbi:MAG: IPT/TIG domain-containing protein, partial [Prevotella sp.]|nr:IPT/TIG domain-containing protein [Prevotella sp.]
MKRNILKIEWSLMLLLMMAFQFTVTSCSDDDSNGGGQPVITAVRVPDPTKADSTFTKAGPGQVIAIIGQNLSNALKVYINNQEVYFNSTMNTDHSIIVTIPSETDGFKLSAFDSSIPDEIRVETTHGTAVYSFKITAPGPQLQRIQALYPRETGDTLTFYGLNLVDIEKIYITDLQQAQLDTTVWTEVGGNHFDITNYYDVKQDHHLNTTTKAYETSSIVGALVPANAPDSGTVVIECAAGTTYVGFYKRPGKPVILYSSSDMPQIGETLILTGREFVQVESVTYGDVTLTPNEFTVSSSEDSIYVNFTKKPTNGSATTLTVTTPGGSASVERFYDYTTILTTFDGDAIDNGWGPNAVFEDSGTDDGVYGRIN